MTGQTIIADSSFRKAPERVWRYVGGGDCDSGYCSEKNLLYLKENGIRSYIKLQDHEKRKTRAYKEDIGKYYNMTYAVFEDEHYYICHDWEGAAPISVRKAKSWTAIPRRWKYTAVRTAAAVSINPNVFTDTMRKRIPIGIKDED